ncbi:T9SS type A sorting domain-containing protein [Psychroserpens sp. SPM9]|uniref:T9SS type A sorting domain-containing protein n=1 Tax=Psychroserpens sp. SPM9 TaxID=2975598 RepID=UPI0021A5D9B3|nr:T9SS type A sorting domain-containing protein [Psychroserpens sp. SPM9]MDG5489986.1 T9SS type A sorting domain-containing protein [Psychroserpens sp. SPM9]
MKKITLLLILLSFSFSFGQVLTEDFEGGLTIPATWTNDDIAGGGETWAIATGGEAVGYQPPNTIYYTDGLMSGNYALFDSDGFGGAGPAEEAALTSPAFSCAGLTSVRLSFNHFFTAGYGGEGFVEVYDGSTWVEVAYYTGAAQENSSFGFEQLDVSTELAGVTNAQVRFRWVGDYAWGWAFDDVIVEEGPSCTTPSDFAAGTVTTTTFELTWLDSNPGSTSWEIEWGDEGFTQGTGTPVFGLTTPTYDFMGLTADTAYDVYIRSNCSGGNGNSEWVGPLTFLTPFDCTTYGIPYSQDFDNDNAFVSCYTIEDVDGDAIAWISQQDLDLDGDLVPETFATNGNSTANTKNDWLFSPAFSLTQGTEYEVTTRFNTFQGNGSLEAFIVDSPSSTATVQIPLFSVTDVPTQGEFETLETMAYEEINAFTPSTTGDYYIAYRSFGPANSGFILMFNSSLDTSLSVDDFDSNNFSYSYNKTTQKLTIESSNLPFDGIEIYSLLGQKVIDRRLSQATEVIEMSQLTKGVYLATVTINGNSKTIKLIKQ